MTRSRQQRSASVAKDAKPTASVTAPKPAMKVRAEAVDLFRKAQQTTTATFAFPEFPPGVKPKAGMAMDDAFGDPMTWAQSQATLRVGEGVQFFGYTLLAEMSQRPEYRKISETIATEMTRKWIEIQATTHENDDGGKNDKINDRIKAINEKMDALRVRDVFRKAAEHDGFFGRAHIFLDLGEDSGAELGTPIGDGGPSSKAKVGKGKLKALRTVEAMWTYPQLYNSNNPLSKEWYRPQQWLVMGTAVHATRLLTLVGRPVPDILKPAYAFGGLSLSQMAKPYVDNWLRTRQSVSDIIQAFSVFVLETDLGSILQGGLGDSLDHRLNLFNLTRDNRGLMAINKDTEAFQNVSAPLGTLDALQAQAQEQMASVSSIPLVKLLGITPSGLNASSDGEVRVFYDHINAYQEHLFRAPLTTVINMIQLSEFGEVDPAITFRFVPLWSMSEKELAEVKKIEAETAQIHIDSGTISPEEDRQRIAADPDTPYTNLDVNDVPNLSDEEAEGLVVKGESGEGGSEGEDAVKDDA